VEYIKLIMMIEVLIRVIKEKSN